MISVAERSDDHHQLPQISLPGSDVHYISFYSVTATNHSVVIIMVLKMVCEFMRMIAVCVHHLLVLCSGTSVAAATNCKLFPCVQRQPLLIAILTTLLTAFQDVEVDSFL